MDNKNIDILEQLDISLDLNNNSEIETLKIEDIFEEEKNEDLVIEDNNLEIENFFEESSKKESKKRNSFVSAMIFGVKYIITSSMIFGVLLLGTNYSAYSNIAMSYIFKGQVEENRQRLISSVEASNIKEKYSKEISEEIKKEKIEEKHINKISIKKMKKQEDKKDLKLNIEITPYSNRIIIPKIGKNIPLIDIKNRKIDNQKELNNIFMDELENGIIRYPGSAKPGEIGTSFIFGHSSNFPWIKGEYNDVFATLDNVVFDDKIIVYYGQKKYTYKVREKKVITPGDVSVLQRNKKKSEITLMTCWPIGTTLNRLIVVGELIED